MGGAGDRKTLLFKAFTVGLCLVVAAVAIAFISEQRDRYPDYEDLVRFDPAREGGHLIPNLDLLVTGERLGDPVRFITNSKGFRNDREFEYAVRPGVERILLYGDSFIDGIRTDQEDTIGRVLEKSLNERGRETEFEVLISGHNNPANAWYSFQEYGHRYDPSVVILGVTLGNDLTWHNYGAGVVPIRRPDGGVALEMVDTKRFFGRSYPDLMLPEAAYLPEAGGDLRRDLGLWGRRVRAEWSYRFSYDVPPSVAPFESRRRRFYAADFSVSLGLFYEPLLPEVEEMYADLEQVLTGFDAECRRHGAAFVAVLLPVRIQVSAADWELLHSAYSLDPSRFDLDLPNRRIASFCRREGIALVDLLPEFRRAASSREEPLYLPLGDMHFNVLGQAVAARGIADFVWESRRPAPGPERRAGPERPHDQRGDHGTM